MAGLLGLNDLRSLAVPLGVDADYLKANSMKDGTSYDFVISEMVRVLDAVNSSLTTDPIYGQMFYPTEDIALEYESGTITEMGVRTEYQGSDNQRVGQVSHTLPMTPFDHPFGWTYDYLLDANMSRLRRNIGSGGRAVKNNLQKRLLTRFFSNAENQISGSGYDMPFANASTTVPYTPPGEDGQSFVSTHTHFDRQADSANGRAVALNNGVDHLWEHGLDGQFYCIIPVADITDFVGLNETAPKAQFIRPVRAGINFADSVSTTENTRGNARFIGEIETERAVVRVWATSRVPANYLGIYQGFGPNSNMAPLAVRYRPSVGFGAYVLGGVGFRKFPFEGATILMDFGVGVSEKRLNGYACYFAASGNYTSPTIS